MPSPMAHSAHSTTAYPDLLPILNQDHNASRARVIADTAGNIFGGLAIDDRQTILCDRALEVVPLSVFDGSFAIRSRILR